MSYATPAAIREPSPPSVEETVAATASDFWSLAKRRALLIGACACVVTVLAGAYLARQTPVYRASAAVLVDPQALQVVGKDIVRTDTAASIDFANIDSQALVMTSNSVLNQLVDELKLEDDPAFETKPGLLARLLGGQSPAQTRTGTIDNVRKAVVARRVDNSLVFEITASHPQADRSALIANRLAAIYLRQGQDDRGTAVKRAGENLLGQLSSLRDQLNDAEIAVERFRASNGLISTGEAGLIVNQQLKDLYTQITASESEVGRLAARREQIARLGPDSLLSDRIAEALNSPTIMALRTQYAELSREAARLSETLLPRHPRLAEARGELAAARKSLSDELDRIRASIIDDGDRAKANLAKLRERAASLTKSQTTSSEAEIKLRQLESEAVAIRAVYNASLARAKELEQQGKIETSNSRLISAAAAPLKATQAPAVFVLPAAFLFGACAGLALAYLLDLVRGAAPSTRAVAEMFGVSSYATLRRRGARLDERDGAELVAIARRLRRRAGSRNPAVVVVGGTHDLEPAVRRDLLAGLARALAGVGEGVWICNQAGRDAPMQIERIRPVHAAPSEPSSVNGTPLVAAAERARAQRVLDALEGRREKRDETSEFLLLSDDDAAGLAASSAIADSVVIVFEPGRTARRTLRELAAMLDPSGERVAAVIGVEPSHAKPTIRTPSFGLKRPAKAAA